MPESEKVWTYKPWWCQPWSIVLTGIGFIAGSWFMFKMPWLTLLVAIPVLTWMGYFLIVYPKAFKAFMDEQGDRP